MILGKMVLQLAKEPSQRLLKHVVRCYLRLSDNTRACEALCQCLPDQLKVCTYLQAAGFCFIFFFIVISSSITFLVLVPSKISASITISQRFNRFKVHEFKYKFSSVKLGTLIISSQPCLSRLKTHFSSHKSFSYAKSNCMTRIGL